jgi:hypothetical protein
VGSSLKKKCKKVLRFTGAGDKGIDIAGFNSAKLLKGVWDNYQQAPLTIDSQERHAAHSLYLSPLGIHCNARQGAVELLTPRFEVCWSAQAWWCGRGDSNPHPLTGSRFSYHFDFRRRRWGVRGLDYPFAMAFGP